MVMKYNKQKDNGFTLVELLIVLVVISLALVVVAIKPKVIAQLDTYKVNNAIDIMVSQSSVWRGSKYNYNGISVKGMCEQQLLPFEVCGASNDGSGANPFWQ